MGCALVRGFFQKEIPCVARQLRGGQFYRSLRLRFHTTVPTCLLHDEIFPRDSLYLWRLLFVQALLLCEVVCLHAALLNEGSLRLYNSISLSSICLRTTNTNSFKKGPCNITDGYMQKHMLS